ncbi:MAG: hypothetical protein LBF74_10605 [Treponema sp.]|jgi:hypothetical protein|nr:hypothetical protein [Treponema sp.]
MANKKIWLRTLVMALAFGLALSGCKQDSDDGGGGGTLTIKINMHDDGGTTYYVGPVWEAGGGWSASGYHAKSGVTDANGVVTVEYTSDDISNVWGEDCYIAWHTSDFIVSGTRSNAAYKKEARTIKLDYNGDEDPSL